MSRIVFAGEPGGHSEIFVMNADGSGIVQLTHTNGDDSHPHWSADGSRIMFNSSRNDTRFGGQIGRSNGMSCSA